MVCPAKRKSVCKKRTIATCPPKREKRRKRSKCIRKIRQFTIPPPQINIIFPVGLTGLAGLTQPPSLPGIHESVEPPKVTAISILPKVRRYFYIAKSDIHLTSTKIIAAKQFINDEGELADQFKDFGANGYFNLYVNAVLQEGKMYQVTTGTLTFTSTGQIIPAGTPIILESVGFAVELSPN